MSILEPTMNNHALLKFFNTHTKLPSEPGVLLWRKLWPKTSKYSTPHQGKQECARRRKQTRDALIKATVLKTTTLKTDTEKAVLSTSATFINFSS